MGAELGDDRINDSECSIRGQAYACEDKGFQQRHTMPPIGPRWKGGNVDDEICGVLRVNGGEHLGQFLESMMMIGGISGVAGLALFRDIQNPPADCGGVFYAQILGENAAPLGCAAPDLPKITCSRTKTRSHDAVGTGSGIPGHDLNCPCRVHFVLWFVQEV